MATYAQVNGAWPDDLKPPTPKEALAGAKRLIRLAYRIANEDREIKISVPRLGKMKITSGRRYTYPRRGVWYVNPNNKHFYFDGWRGIVHGISHWAGRRFWPGEDPHSPRHVWIEKVMVDYAVKHFLAGQLARPTKDKPQADPIATRAKRVADAIGRWEAKKRRAENALRKLRRRQGYYERRIAA